jgi:hypothetical protein
MSPATCWAIVGLLAEAERAASRRDLRAVRAALTAISRLVIGEADDQRRRS